MKIIEGMWFAISQWEYMLCYNNLCTAVSTSDRFDVPKTAGCEETVAVYQRMTLSPV